jgi:oligoribonuclease NrnB/cAMP/cGMP phosphodiesterase (DHH superfamily)
MAFTSEYMVEIDEAQKMERELAAMTKDRDKWKANHDNQVAINRTLRDRPDLGERAKLVDALTKQRDALAEALSPFVKLNPLSKRVQEKWHGYVLNAKQALAATKGGSDE